MCDSSGGSDGDGVREMDYPNLIAGRWVDGPHRFDNRNPADTVNGAFVSTDIGPAVDQQQLDTVLRYVERGRAEGARLACGGRRLVDPPFDHGYFVEPAVFVAVHEQMTIAQEEIFGPVLAVLKASDFDGAVRMANAVAFGLSASVQTRDLSRAFEFINRIDAGLITVNLPSAGVELPVAVWRDQGLKLRTKGTGPPCVGLLL